MPELIYPSAEKVIAYNYLALEIIKVKKADKPHLLSMAKLQETIQECKDNTGDIYDKATTLLKGIVKKHPFASGNRRTAFIATKAFVLANKGKFSINDDPAYAKNLQGVREDYYTVEEIKEWIKNGKIKEFKR